MKYKIMKSIHDGNFYYKMKSLILGKMLKLDHTQMVVAYRQMLYNKLKKKYAKKIQYHSVEYKAPIKKVWVCWFQGLENAPLIVQRAIASIYEKFDEWEIQLLTKDNLREFTTIPEYVLNKWEKGLITHAHFSDILRVNLLYEYGGIWIDATTYFTDVFPEYLIDSDLFYFNHLDRKDYALVMDSWLIYAKPHHPILEEVQKLLYLYWQKKKHLCEYFLVHLFFRMVLEKYPEEWENIPFKSSIDAHILIGKMNKEFQSREFEFIKQQSFCHKLNYKDKMLEDKANTFYMKLIKETNV